MAKKGANKKQKRISEKKHIHLRRKEKVWTIRVQAGGPRKEEAIALGTVLRDLIGLAKNLREVKAILNNGKVKVNGIIRRDYKFPLTLFDVLEAGNEYYRIIVDKKGRFKVYKEDKKPETKIIKLYSKKKVKENKINLKFNDGTNIVVDKTKLKVGDSVLFDFRKDKIIEEIPFETGTIVYIYKGSHSGQTGKIEEIAESTQTKKSLVNLKVGDKEIQTIKDKLIAIGKGKPALKIGEIQ